MESWFVFKQRVGEDYTYVACRVALAIGVLVVTEMKRLVVIFVVL